MGQQGSTQNPYEIPFRHIHIKTGICRYLRQAPGLYLVLCALNAWGWVGEKCALNQTALLRFRGVFWGGFL